MPKTTYRKETVTAKITKDTMRALELYTEKHQISKSAAVQRLLHGTLSQIFKHEDVDMGQDAKISEVEIDED